MSVDETKSIGKRRQLQGVAGFLWKERRPFLLLTLLLMLVAAWVADLSTEYDHWATWDKMLTLFTLAVGLAVFFGEAIEDWEERLSKRLTVYFQVDGVTRMVCYQAHLPHEGDIRNWGQQIGRQMCGEMLEFSPYLDLQRLGVEHRGDVAFTHFQAVIYLKKVPQKLSEQLHIEEEKSGGQALCKVLRAGEKGEELHSFEKAELHRQRQGS